MNKIFPFFYNFILNEKNRFTKFTPKINTTLGIKYLMGTIFNVFAKTNNIILNIKVIILNTLQNLFFFIIKSSLYFHKI